MSKQDRHREQERYHEWERENYERERQRYEQSREGVRMTAEEIGNIEKAIWDTEGVVVKHCQKLLQALQAERERVEELEAGVDLRHNSDMRAIARWREDNPGNELRWPDHTDLSVWLMGRIEELETVAKNYSQMWADSERKYDVLVGELRDCAPDLANLARLPNIEYAADAHNNAIARIKALLEQEARDE